MPIILPIDPRRSTTMERDRDHEGHDRKGEEDRAFQARDRRREGLRGKVQAVDTDKRHVHFVGHFAASKVVPWKIA